MALLPILAGIGSAVGLARNIGGLFGGGGGGGSQNIQQSPLIQQLGVDPGQLAQNLQVSPQEQQASIDQLMRTLGTLQAQGLNRSRDFAAAQNLPVATQLARERGQRIGIAQQAQAGQLAIEQQAAQQNRAASQFLLSMLSGDQAAQQQLSAQRRGQTLQALSGIGQALGLAIGAGVFGGGSGATTG